MLTFAVKLGGVLTNMQQHDSDVKKKMSDILETANRPVSTQHQAIEARFNSVTAKINASGGKIAIMKTVFLGFPVPKRST